MNPLIDEKNCDISDDICEEAFAEPVIPSKQITNKLLLCKGSVKPEDLESFVKDEESIVYASCTLYQQMGSEKFSSDGDCVVCVPKKSKTNDMKPFTVEERKLLWKEFKDKQSKEILERLIPSFSNTTKLLNLASLTRDLYSSEQCNSQ